MTPLKHFNTQFEAVTGSLSYESYCNLSTCWCWRCWRCWRCCCRHHPAHHLGGVWTPPPTLHTYGTWARWSKPWLPTLVEYHWANSGSGVLHNHLTGCIAGISTGNSTSCMGTANKCSRHFRKESDGYFVINNDFWKSLWRTNLSISPIVKYWGTDKVFSPRMQ